MADLAAQGLLPLALCAALRQRSGQGFDVLIQTLDSSGRLLLLLADAPQISLAVFACIAGPLCAQLSFRQPLLQLMHPLIQLRDPSAHRLQRTFLSGFFSDPLCQLCLT